MNNEEAHAKCLELLNQAEEDIKYLGRSPERVQLMVEIAKVYARLAKGY